MEACFPCLSVKGGNSQFIKMTIFYCFWASPVYLLFYHVFIVLEKDSRSAIEFHGGESVALDRLNHYLWQTDSVATYKETRNGMIGADYSTKFSSWYVNPAMIRSLDLFVG